MKDPAYLIESTYQKTADFLIQEFEDEEHLRRSAFRSFLVDYEGYDIIEVICREASVLSIYETSTSIPPSGVIFSREVFFKHLADAADKYAQSENWPMIETDRAKAFKDYICIIQYGDSI